MVNRLLLNFRFSIISHMWHNLNTRFTLLFITGLVCGLAQAEQLTVPSPPVALSGVVTVNRHSIVYTQAWCLTNAIGVSGRSFFVMPGTLVRAS